MDSWTSLAVGALAAIAVGGILFVTGGAVSPVAGSLGTWVGSLYGYSGAAATNFGLALLGAGAVASGGLGAGGAQSLLGSVLGFSTDVVVDYASPQVIEHCNPRTSAAALSGRATCRRGRPVLGRR